ncbi:MAG: DUF502 domain-containing protein [bacterium]|nr:DUF502 domain-containing protein [bacterium]
MSEFDPETGKAEHPVRTTILSALTGFVRTRIIQGLLLALPILITFWILHWLYATIRERVIDPVAYSVSWAVTAYFNRPDAEPPIIGIVPEGDAPFVLPEWFDSFAAPILATAIIVGLLYLLGMFFQSRLHLLLDWILMQVPVVTTIYAAVRKVFDSLARQRDAKHKFQRVVLIGFPHPGTKVPAFVTSSCVDVKTGKTILCVYVPTTPIPTSGYMLMVPEEEVNDLSWDINETLQAIVSGGISVPERVEYFPPNANIEFDASAPAKSSDASEAEPPADDSK